MGWKYTLTELARIVGAETPKTDAPFDQVSTDTRALTPGAVFFALSGPNFDGNRFVADAFAKGAVAAVTTTPSDAGSCLVTNDPLRALHAFAAHHRATHPIPILALTGSCGKTSTKDMIARLLATRHRVVKTQGNLNNEIGCPLSLLQIDADTDIAVIEMGANHAGEIAALCSLARPTESAITMIAPAHLEGFGSIENVAKAKAEIVQALDQKHGTFFVNNDDEWCKRIGAAFPGEKRYFGSCDDTETRGCNPLSTGSVLLKEYHVIGPGEMRLIIEPVGELRLPLACRAHAQNVLLAIAVGLHHAVTEFEQPLREACAASARFKVFTLGPLTIIDDTYNANPASMAAALQALAQWPATGSRMAALGEMLELGEAAQALHRDIGALTGQLGITRLYAKGPHARDMVEAALSSGTPYAEVLDDPAAIARAIHQAAQPGDVLLAKGSRGMRMEQVIEALKEGT